MERATVLELFAKADRLITFNKLNGETRCIFGTINLKHIPKKDHPAIIEEYDNYFHLYDLDDNCWKTVYFDRIIKIT